MDTKDKIVQSTTKIFSRHGYDGLSMRTLAKDLDISQSVIYHHFADKEVLLKHMFDTINTALGQKRAILKESASASDMLRERVRFQFENAQEVAAVLKYFLHYRKNFPKITTGYVPDKAYLHIEEVLALGVASGEFRNLDIKKEAKIITHAINGFVLEYFPAPPQGQEQQELIEDISTFILRSIIK